MLRNFVFCNDGGETTPAHARPYSVRIEGFTVSPFRVLVLGVCWVKAEIEWLRLCRNPNVPVVSAMLNMDIFPSGLFGVGGSSPGSPLGDLVSVCGAPSGALGIQGLGFKPLRSKPASLNKPASCRLSDFQQDGERPSKQKKTCPL